MLHNKKKKISLTKAFSISPWNETNLLFDYLLSINLKLNKSCTLSLLCRLWYDQPKVKNSDLLTANIMKVIFVIFSSVKDFLFFKCSNFYLNSQKRLRYLQMCFFFLSIFYLKSDCMISQLFRWNCTNIFIA